MNAGRGARSALRGCLWAALSLFGIVVPAARAQTPAQQGTEVDAGSKPDAEDAAVAAASRPFFVDGAAYLGGLYDSNLAGGGNGGSGGSVQGGVDLRAHEQSAHFVGDLAYGLNANYHPDHPDLNSIQNYLNALGHAELVPEHLYLTGRAFAWPTFITRLGPLDAGNGNSASGNSRNAYGYLVSPDFLLQFDGYAQSDLSIQQSGQFFSTLGNNPPTALFPFGTPSSAQATTVSERITSGENFGRLKWVLIASGTDSAQGAFSQRERIGQAELEYHLDRNFALVGNVGYRNYASRPTLNHNISGIIAMGGFSYELDNSFELLAKYGRQYNFDSYTGKLLWQVTAESAVTATVDDTVTTPQERLLMGLNGLSADQGGFSLSGSNLPDQALLTGLIPNTGAPVDIAPLDGLALDNAMSRYRTATASLVHKMPRWTYTVTAYGSVRDYLLPVTVGSLRQTIYGGDVSLTHELSHEFSATIRGDYSIAHEFGGIDKIAGFNVTLNYALAENWSINGQANYISRDARNFTVISAGNTSDLQLGAGLRYNF